MWRWIHIRKMYQIKKIKNIRPSVELIVEFLNWSIDRIRSNNELVKKYNKKS